MTQNRNTNTELMTPIDMIRRFFSAICLFLSASSAFATNIKTISSEEGLTNNAIMAIHQDRRSHIWIGTSDGLNIWNGHSIEVFGSKDGYNYFSGNRIRHIIPSESDNIYIHTKYGLARLNTVSKDIEFYKEFALYRHLTITEEENIFALDESNILHYFDARQKSMATISGFSFAKNEQCMRMAMTPKNELCIFTTKGSYIIRFEWDGLQIPSIREISELELECIFAAPPYDGDSGHYIMTDDCRVCFFNYDDISITTICSINDTRFDKMIDEDTITSILPTKDGFYISFLQKGVFFLPNGKDSLEPTVINYGIFSMIPDKNQSIIWLGTDCNGLQRWSDRESSIRTLNFEDLPYSIKMPVRSILMDKKRNLWFGTKGDGLFRLKNLSPDTVYDLGNTDRFTEENSQLGHNSVYALAESHSDMFWIGCEDGGLNWYSYKDDRIRKVEGGRDFRRIHQILEQNDSTLWIVTDTAGAYKCDFKIRSGQPVITRTDTLKFCKPFNFNTSIFTISMQNDSTVWFGSRSHGALSYNVNTGRSRIIKFPTDYGHAINEVLYIAKSDNMLFATGNGIVAYNTEKDTLCVPKDVPKRSIHTILTDCNENIWMSTNQGIISIDKNYNYRTSYNRFSGIDVLEYSDGACWRDKESETLFFGGINGLMIINPDKIETRRETSYIPPIHITDFIQNNEVTHIGSKMKNGKLRIPYSKSIFAVRFSLVDNLSWSDYVFSWKIDGYDKQWRINTSDIIYLPSLDPGHYRLKLKYRNRATRYESEECVLPIYIIPPIYKRWWAMVIYVLLFIYVILRIIRYSKNRYAAMRIKLEQQYAEEIQKIKLETTNSITEELSVLITFILGLCGQLRQSTSGTPNLASKLNLMEYNIAKINNILHILNESKEIPETMSSPSEVMLIPVSQLTLNMIELMSATIKSRKVSLMHDIESGVILTMNKENWQTLFNSLLHRVLSIASGNREVHISLKKSLDDKGILMKFRVTVDKDAGSKFFSTHSESSLHDTLIRKIGGSIVNTYENDEITISIFIPQQHEIITTAPGEAPVNESIDTYNIIAGNCLPQSGRIDLAHDYIYLISANKEISSFIGYFLSEKYNIIEFSDYQSALSDTESRMPVVVIYDYSSMMRHFSDYIAQMKGNKRTKHVSIVALTSSLQMNEREECTKMGADLCISFPFNMEYMQSVVEKLISNRQNIAEYYNSPLSSYEVKDGKFIHQDDKAFFKKVLKTIDENISNPELTAPLIAKELGIGTRVMYRRLEGIGAQNLHEIIKDARMKLAAKLLTTSKLTIDEIIYKVGHENRSTFYRNFKNSYGMTPKEYREQIQKKTLEELN